MKLASVPSEKDNLMMKGTQRHVRVINKSKQVRYNSLQYRGMRVEVGVASPAVEERVSRWDSGEIT